MTVKEKPRKRRRHFYTCDLYSLQLELEYKENIKSTAPLGAIRPELSDFPSGDREVPSKKLFTHVTNNN